MGGNAGRWLAIALGGFAILLVVAWPWLTQSDDERALKALLSRMPGSDNVRIAFGDCPPQLGERLKPLFEQKKIRVRSDQVLESLHDEVIVAAFSGDTEPLFTRLPQVLGDTPIILAWCKGDVVHLQALHPRTRKQLAASNTKLFNKPSHGRGQLHITSRPTGVQVLLDYERAGETPLVLTGLRPGNHHVRLVHPQFFTMEESVELSADQTSYRLYTLEQGQGFAAMTSEPPGAAVYLGGQLQPETTPMLLGPLPAGVYRWELRHAAGTERGEVAIPTKGTARVEVRFAGAVASEPAKWRDPITGMELVWVPGGCYVMGCGSWTDECFPDEIPHEVCVDGFWMGRFEVTRAQWGRVMGGGQVKPDEADKPVSRISWDDATAFIARLNSLGASRYRLPSEAEWEYACRSGGKPEKYAGVESRDEQRAGRSFLQQSAWVGEGWESGPFVVGQKQPNGLGLHDMSGNVWEWIADTFHPEAYLRHSGKNPVYDGPGDEYMVRGGSWFGYNQLARCSHRYRFPRDFNNADIGFRLVRIDCGADSPSGKACVDSSDPRSAGNR